jgi:arylsulfatase A-like enzyme
MPDDDVLLARRAYRASVAFVDEQVGAVFDALRDTGLLDNTLVLFTADHGDGQGDHYHWRKGYPYVYHHQYPFASLSEKSASKLTSLLPQV